MARHVPVIQKIERLDPFGETGSPDVIKPLPNELVKGGIEKPNAKATAPKGEASTSGNKANDTPQHLQPS
jgi:hypothetical protein